MTWEEYEAMINDLANGELEPEKRSAHLVALKKEGATLFTEHEERASKIEELEANRRDLIDENRRLFLEIPTDRSKSAEEIKQEETKEFEQSVTISDLRKGRV
ncbi:head scaffolding protein [Bacillus phage BeachBum]|uniref:Morphogenesis protein n=1 Tax=Bacillus phage BeachBum TaxID=1983461 RepID=A0A1X9SGS8_9CAUD|nr:head scaffolding protein [Bacillus phage BeachBum]ARQ95220.1 morphogenesis protein [Bacillus phage BeachBum]